MDGRGPAVQIQNGSPQSGTRRRGVIGLVESDLFLFFFLYLGFCFGCYTMFGQTDIKEDVPDTGQVIQLQQDM